MFLGPPSQTFQSLHTLTIPRSFVEVVGVSMGTFMSLVGVSMGTLMILVGASLWELLWVLL